MAYIGVVSSSSTSVKVRIYELDSGYASSDRVCTWYLNGNRTGTSTLDANISSGGDYTFTNLKANTTYDISVSITAPSWTYTVDLDATIKTESSVVEPWSWRSSNGSASTHQTQQAYDAVSHNGSLNDFSYLVWNDLVDKVKEVLDALGYSWNSKFDSYNGTKMSSSDKSLTATRFNSLLYNISAHYSIDIDKVSTGDIVYGWYFITLTDCINQWIG